MTMAKEEDKARAALSKLPDSPSKKVVGFDDYVRFDENQLIKTRARMIANVRSASLE